MSTDVPVTSEMPNLGGVSVVLWQRGSAMQQLRFRSARVRGRCTGMVALAVYGNLVSKLKTRCKITICYPANP